MAAPFLPCANLAAPYRARPGLLVPGGRARPAPVGRPHHQVATGGRAGRGAAAGGKGQRQTAAGARAGRQSAAGG